MEPNPITITEFEPALAERLPQTKALLASANLVVHAQVSRLVLHGSRGLAGGCRPESDLDPSLVLDRLPVPAGPGQEEWLRAVCETTLSRWQSPIEIDLAVIFDQKSCGLACFDVSSWEEARCQEGGVDCFGLYKLQKGFTGLVTGAGIQVNRMYPCLKIWQRSISRQDK